MVTVPAASSYELNLLGPPASALELVKREI